jgi:hypothetical protein
MGRDVEGVELIGTEEYHGNMPVQFSYQTEYLSNANQIC